MLSTIVIAFTLINIAVAQYSESSAVVGDEAKLKCRIDIEGTVDVMWLDPENDLLTINEDVKTEDDRISIDHPYRREWILMIDNVHRTDAGNYTCTIGTGMNKVVGLAIHYPPTMETVSPDVSVVAGSDISIKCTASGKPQPKINWYRHTLENERELVVRDQSSLQLRNVTKDIAGTYECEADNGVSPMASGHIQVHVQFLPILTLPYHSFTQHPGRDTLLQCLVTANPLTGHYWMKDGQRLQDSAKYRIQNIEVSQYTTSLGVYVMGLTDEDFGKYVCVAENDFGSVNESLEIFEAKHKGSAEVVEKPQDVISKLGQTIRINCTIAGETSRDNLIWWRRTVAGYEKLFESNPANPLSSFSSRKVNSRDSYSNNADDINNNQNNRETYTHVTPGTDRPSNGGKDIELDKWGFIEIKHRGAQHKRLQDRVEVQGHYNLVLKEAEVGDGGIYVCELVGHQNYSAQVTLVENTTCTCNNTDILQGEMLNISCSLRYHGNDDNNNWVVSWQHEDRQMSSIHRDEVGLLRRVVSFRAWDTDSGKYTCEVRSGDGRFNDTCETVMEVREPPPETMPPVPPTGAPSTGIRTNLSMTGIVLGGALVVITLVLLMILGCTVKYYRNELAKYKTQSPSRYGNGATSVEMESLRKTNQRDSGSSLPEEV